MGYINKAYLETQFQNFANKLKLVFSKVGHKHTQSDITDLPSNLVSDANYVHTDNNYTTTDKDRLSTTLVYGVQTLTEEQKAQVRSNIGAGSSTITVDQQYNASSINPQSGTAVAQALGTLDIPTDLGDLTNNAGYTKNIGTVVTIKMNGSDKTTSSSGVVDLGTVITDISGKADAATTYTKTEVDKKFEDLPEPMQFKGTLGTDGTISTLPVASSENTGFTYKVITAGTYQSIPAQVGDTFISNGSAWTLIPSGDEPSGTVTSVAISNGGGIGVSGSPITSSGSITITNEGVRSTTIDTDGTIKVDTNGTSADLIAVENTNIDFSTYFA